MLTSRTKDARDFFSARLRSRLATNVLSLYAVQGLNYLLPLLTLPFLLRALGPDAYGSVAFAQSVVSYGVIFIEFGFNLTAARDIAIARDDPRQIAKIYWTTVAAKGVLLLLSFAPLCALLFVTKFRDAWPVFTASSLLLFGNIVFPQWYFQGLERLKELAMTQAIAKCAIAVGVIVCVRTPQDAWVAALLLSAPQIVGALAAVCLGKPLAPDEFYRPCLADIRQALAQSWHPFASSASASLYLHANTVVLGLMCNERAVAIYSVSTRIVAALQGLGTPVTQAIFPRASRLFATDKPEAWRFVSEAMWWVLPAFAAICTLTAMLAPQIVRVLAGNAFAETVAVLRIMAGIPLLVMVAILLSQVVMINAGLARHLTRIYLAVGLLNLVILPVLILVAEAEGAAWSLLIAETLGPLLMIRVLRKNRVQVGY